MTLGSHQTTVGKSQDWITPEWVFDVLGPFDLDPCASKTQPWRSAITMLTEDGLQTLWHGRVWLNPPFDRYEVGKWTAKLADHGNGTALLHARTEAEWFVPCWKYATAMLFLAHRLYFHYPNGNRAAANSGAPAVLVAFSPADALRLSASKIPGYYVSQWSTQK